MRGVPQPATRQADIGLDDAHPANGNQRHGGADAPPGSDPPGASSTRAHAPRLSCRMLQVSNGFALIQPLTHHRSEHTHPMVCVLTSHTSHAHPSHLPRPATPPAPSPNPQPSAPPHGATTTPTPPTTWSRWRSEHEGRVESSTVLAALDCGLAPSHLHPPPRTRPATCTGLPHSAHRANSSRAAAQNLNSNLNCSHILSSSSSTLLRRASLTCTRFSSA